MHTLKGFTNGKFGYGDHHITKEVCRQLIYFPAIFHAGCWLHDATPPRLPAMM